QAFLREMSIPYLHVFPYSERPDTPAAHMPAISFSERKTRASLLRALGEEAAMRYYTSLLNQPLRVLMETTTQGRSEQFAPVRLNKGEARVGDIITLNPIFVESSHIVAERM
ncbi:MAG: tRNA (N(6)-L-threonylcarbamoyladenosine(37)-C(2))-methylthiotransferase MtaB, partial [Acetobacter sp.]|nr:tRNA (N(6)-L-threonylcarbamoyladenosine(37)-C(2))-methylthiotransferase MtaB [Acetobacter sp.]